MHDTQHTHAPKSPLITMRETFHPAIAMTCLDALSRRGTGVARLTSLLLSGLLSLTSAACTVGSGSGDQAASSLDPLPYRTNGSYVEVRRGDDYDAIFMKGINLGVGVPGTQPGELAITRDQYGRWFEQMHDMGANVLRIYTLHFPRFYEEFAAHNARYPGDPLYLMQGIWLDEENPTGDFFDMSELYDREIENVIGAVHGDAEVEQEYGKAFGTYTVDVSAYVIAWVVGREVYPDEIEYTDAVNAERTSFEGGALSVVEAEPMVVWLAERMDKVITFERDTFGVQRPVSFSSWPTLDPLTHAIEGDGSDEDRVNLDMLQVDFSRAPGGFFIIYHAYPYYPDFIVETPEYADAEDDFGRNSYLGYLRDLKEHYADIPLVIGEFGTPSSWGNAHYGQSGMHHGGHDEADVGHYGARMMTNMYDSGCAGGAYFAWMDEWWKRTWITDELDFPRERRYRWHNVTAAEQNFGLIAFELGPAPFETVSENPAGRVREIELAADAQFFRARVTLDQTFTDEEQLVVGLDTYRDDLGESFLPLGYRSIDLRHEFAIHLNGHASAQHLTTPEYDTYGIWHNTASDVQRFHSMPTDRGDWTLVRWKNNSPHLSSDLRFEFPETSTDIGELVVRTAADPPSSLDAIVIDD
ncbi:MAG: hypothetical protein ACI81R_003670, partial [Bradymonadia bacterium]